MKKALLMGMAFVLCIGTLCLAACKKKPQGNTSDEGYENVLEIESTDGYINYSEYRLEIFERFEVKAFGTGAESVSYASADDTIAFVGQADGVVTAKAVGTTNVEAVFNGNTYVCRVTVVNSGCIPIVISGLIFDKVELRAGSEYLPELSIGYNKRQYADAEYSFSVDDSGICSVTAKGEIIALKPGITMLTVTAAWRGCAYCEPLEIDIIVL